MSSISLITGGSGLLGQAIQYSSFENISNTKLKILTRNAAYNTNQNYIHTNYTSSDISRIINQAGKIDTIIHCAGRPSVYLSLKEPIEDHYHNFNPILFSLELARQAKAKIIYFSTVEVYGFEKDELRTEDIIPHPQNFYACNKLFGEHYVKLYHKNLGVDYLILRPGIFIGEAIRKSIVFEFVNGYHHQAKKIPIYCSLDSKLDFVHVDDVAEVLCFLTKQQALNDVWNIGGGASLSVSELKEYFAQEFSYSPELNMLDNEYLYKTAPIKKLLNMGWQPKKHIRERIKQVTLHIQQPLP